MTSPAPPPPWRPLIAPGLATLAGLAILIGLGLWQLERKVWKEGLIARIEARAHGEPGEIVPEASWPLWQASEDEFRRVRVSGAFLNQVEAPVHGLATGAGGRAAQGFFILTPLRRGDGSIVMINRGFVPTELRDAGTRAAGQTAGETIVTGLVRAPEGPRLFVPDNVPARNEWFTRDIAAIATAKGLERVAPFYIDADATPNPGGWPKGGQTPLALPNDHLAYALTWLGLALALIGVFGAFAWRRLKGESEPLVDPLPRP